MALLRSGWLWRQTSVLKRWRLNWCDLWIDGTLVFYKTDSRRDFEHRINLKSGHVDVKTGLQCLGVSPPEGHPRNNLLTVEHSDGSEVIMCTNCEDEALAWKLTIMEVRRDPMLTYEPNDDLYQSVPLNSHNTLYITPGSGTHHVYIQRDPYGGLGESMVVGMLAGMAAGAAMRSFLWMPLWFC